MPGWTSTDIRKMKRAGAYNPYGTLGPSPQRVAAIKPYTPPPITPQLGGVATATPTYKTPNWAAILAGDPDYEAAESEFNLANQMDRGSLRDAIRRAVIESGLQVGQDEDIDAGTLAAARANQYSSAADIANQLRRGSATSDAELAARGLLSSGQFTENRSVLQRGADTARNTLQNSLLNTIASGRQSYAQTVADRRMQLRGIKESIAARLAQNPALWVADQPAGGRGTTSPAGAYGYGPRGTTAGETPYERALRLRSEGLNKQYGLGGPVAGGGGGGGGANPADITGYTWQNGVQYAVMRDGRKLPASAFGARF